MKLYLASYAMVTMAKIIKHEKHDFTGKKAIFIPTAGDPYDNKILLRPIKLRSKNMVLTLLKWM